jgi:hypothetical protein
MYSDANDFAEGVNYVKTDLPTMMYNLYERVETVPAVDTMEIDTTFINDTLYEEI